MGSTSSKEHDPNPAELGTYASGGQYPLRHHPQYGSGSASGGGDADGHDPYYTKGAADAKGFESARSDDAMDIDQPSLDSDSTSNSTSGGAAESGSAGDSLGGDASSAVVPMVFRWEHGGRNVYITGTFNGWSKQCPMHRSGNDFTYIANLTRGKHAYKFVVDDEWRFAPDQLTVADVEGNVNNFVDVSEFTPLSDFESSGGAGDERDENGDSAYGRFIPDIDEYTKEPPPLPPHLRHIILNKTPPTVDSRLLPVPQHVALNHLYCTAIKDGMMVLGITNLSCPAPTRRRATEAADPPREATVSTRAFGDWLRVDREGAEWSVSERVREQMDADDILDNMSLSDDELLDSLADDMLEEMETTAADDGDDDVLEEIHTVAPTAATRTLSPAPDLGRMMAQMMPMVSQMFGGGASAPPSSAIRGPQLAWDDVVRQHAPPGEQSDAYLQADTLAASLLDEAVRAAQCEQNPTWRRSHDSLVSQLARSGLAGVFARDFKSQLRERVAGDPDYLAERQAADGGGGRFANIAKALA
ncbi:hypothetical protein PybrP1_001394, partial [[Pythium] brassicae (nom. inval.)]